MPVPSPTPSAPDVHVVGTPSDGDTVVWNAGNGQWEPGAAGGGVSPSTVFEALLPLGKIDDPGYSGGPTLYWEGSDEWSDGGWLSWVFTETTSDLFLGTGPEGATGYLANMFAYLDEAQLILYDRAGADGTIRLSVNAYGDNFFHPQILVQAGTAQIAPMIDLQADGCCQRGWRSCRAGHARAHRRMNDQLAALALVISEQRLTIGRQAAELQAAQARIAELKAAAKPARKART